VNPRDVARRRMASLGLWGPGFASPEETVGTLTAMQAQEYGYAKWAVAQRAGDVGEAEMDRRCNAGAILRTHVLRPTWHFVLPSDIRWLLALTGPRVHAVNGPYYRKLGLDDAVLGRGTEVIASALEGGRHRTRKELGAVLEQAGIDASNLGLGYLLMHAELEAVICSGARRGRQQTYALLDERAPETPAMDRDEALAQLTRRYFTRRGPATLKDFAWWSGLTQADGRRGLELNGDALSERDVGGRSYWFAGEWPDAVPAHPAVDLVQVYDEVVLSYSESRDMLLAELAGAGGPWGEDAVLIHAILLDGQLIGHWRRVLARGACVVETWCHRPLDGAETSALDDAVARFGRFLGIPATREAVSRRP
jgi:hypothetical protein